MAKPKSTAASPDMSRSKIGPDSHHFSVFHDLPNFEKRVTLGATRLQLDIGKTGGP
jgi:hypothetical protein